MKVSKSHSHIPKRVVILGAEGTIGFALARVLRALQIPILALSRKEIDLTGDEASKHLSALFQINDVVIVFAVQKPGNNMDTEAFINNLKIANNVCLALRTVKDVRVIYFSSDAVYSFESEMISEQTLAAPETLYGSMHLSREIQFRNAIEEDLLMIIRSTQVYGSMKENAPYGPDRMYLSAIQEGKIELFGKGEELRDFIHIQDVVQLIVLLIQQKCSGIINFATGISISYADLSNIISSSLDTKIEITLLTRKTKIKHRHFNIDKISDQFPNFKFIRLEESIRNLQRERLVS